MDNRIIFYGEVLDVDDPLNLGRIRVRVKTQQQQSIEQGLPTNGDDLWTTNDPFLTYPLLPIFFYQVPKKGEFVHVVYYDKDYIGNNRFYIQGNFSNIDGIQKGEFNDMVSGLALGERNKPSPNVNSQNTSIPVSSDNFGLYPTPNTVGLLGRQNSDILLPEDGFIARIDKQFTTNGTTTFNKNYSFTMLQNYPFRTLGSNTKESEENFTDYPPLNYLIEYNVYGGMGIPLETELEAGRERLFSGYIEVYGISKYKKVPTTAFTSDNIYIEVDEDSKIGPIFRKDYLSATFNDITQGIKQVIKNLNDRNVIGLDGGVTKTVSDSFPFVFQPSKPFYDLLIGTKEVERENANEFAQEIFLNVTDFQRGYGLVCQKNLLGPLIEKRKIKYESPITLNQPTAVGMTASDFVFLLSHESQIPGLNKINFSDVVYNDLDETGKVVATNIINQNYVWEQIYPNTNSMVRGEKLLNLLELMVKFMINHVHPYHNMPPNPVAKDQTSTQEIFTEMFNGYENILNQKLRIN